MTEGPARNTVHGYDAAPRARASRAGEFEDVPARGPLSGPRVGKSDDIYIYIYIYIYIERERELYSYVAI